MAAISIYLKTDYKSKDLRYPIYVKVRHKKVVKIIPVGFKVKESEWNELEKKVVKHENRSAINAKISDIVREVDLYLQDAVLHNTSIDLGRMNKSTAATFTDYLLHRAGQYNKLKQTTQERKLKVLERELTALFGILEFKEITVDTLRTYHASLKDKKKPNTIHKQFTTLRQLFSNAINEGIYIGANPFMLFKVKKMPVKKDKLTVDEIARIEDEPLTGSVAIARDMFMLAYYAKGIRFENVVFLHNKNIIAGRIFVKTNKGGESISIKIHDKLQTILDRYPDKGYVFPFVKGEVEDKRKFLDSVNVMVNRDLKVVAAAAKVHTNLTFHLSRHAILYHLKQQGVSISAISDIAGHSNPTITQAYLKSLDDEALDSEMDKVYK